MTTETEAPQGADSDQAANGLVIRPEVVALYESMIADVPEAGANGYESILVQIAAAESVDALDAPWRADGLKEYLNVPLSIRGLRRMPSEYVGGLPFFLIVDAAVIETGETVTVTTGAVSVVAQLAKGNQLGLIPGWRVIPRQADRPSSSGYFPQHLETMHGRLANERS